MGSEKVKQFLETLKNDPEAAKLLKGYETSADQAGEFRIYAEIASQLDYDITEEELKAYMEEAAAFTAEKTEEAAAQIEELSDDVLDGVAGGKEHKNCKDTYRNYENCWITDGCDQIYVMYDDYLCHKHSFDNPCHETAEPCDEGRYCYSTPIFV